MHKLPRRYRLAAAALSGATGLAGAAPNAPAIARTLSSSASVAAALSRSTTSALQEVLNKRGIAVNVDGAPNDGALAAVRKYQPQHHLPVTGEPDMATLDKPGPVVRQSTAPTQSGATEPRVPIQATPMQAMQRVSSMSTMDRLGRGPITADKVQGESATMTGGVSLKARR